MLNEIFLRIYEIIFHLIIQSVTERCDTFLVLVQHTNIKEKCPETFHL
jgi:hypothetical protein